MPVSVDWVVERMEDYAPSGLAMDWDNVGLLVGPENNRVDKILVALDLTEDVLEEAVKAHAGMIVTHHPLIFGELKAVTHKNPLGRRIIKLIKNNISVYSAHTNLDIADGGTNDELFEILGLINKEKLDDETGMGRTGFLQSPLKLSDFCGEIKARVGLERVRFAGEQSSIIKKVGICTGSGAERSLMKAAAEKKCDAYVTGDIKYHSAQEALDFGLCLIDATHYGSEVIIVERICSYLREAAEGRAEILASEVDARTIFEL